MKIINFKTVSPMFEMERDGIKPFTCRQRDSKDPRFKPLLHFRYGSSSPLGIRITNPATGESFIREVISRARLTDRFVKADEPEWWIIYLGDRIEVKGGNNGKLRARTGTSCVWL